MSKEELLILLVSIKTGGDISILSSVFSYSDILNELNRLKNENCIEFLDSEIKLLPKGEKMINKLKMQLKRTKTDWIQPDLREKREKCEEKYIYLPPKDWNR